ncbi:MAG: FAD-binding oxidoreductase, partial [Acidimicrobiia bacterium]
MSTAGPAYTNVLPLAEELRRALSADRVEDSPLHLSIYGHDASGEQGKASVVCLPISTGEVQACVRLARKHGVSFVARGSGTGLAGGAVPLDGGMVIVTTKMDRIIEVNTEERYAWVEPGVLNLDLTRAVTPLGLHFAPDPSSQQSCSIGGNIANNTGGPHCLAYGVTSPHVLA